jgi:echinoderm microtubule-associated protein-like 1/2
MNYMNCIMNSHAEELWGLAASARDSHFLTCGNDKIICYWDTLSHSLIWQSSQFDDHLHCINVHPEFDLAAIGLSKPKWIIFDLVEHKVVFSQIEGTEQIECILYSPDGAYLAAGSRDNSIYIYSVTDNGQKYSRIGKCHGHSSFITHLDWTTDSQHLRSNSGDYEILFWNAKSCKQITQVQQIRDFIWKTNFCTLTVDSVAIWNSSTATSPSQTSLNGNTDNLNDSSHNSSNDSAILSTDTSNAVKSMDGTDINACCVSNGKNLLATADDFGKVNLYKFPCSGAKSEKRVYNGHSSHVTNVVFINNDTRLISTGGNDMAIFQWLISDQ